MLPRKVREALDEHRKTFRENFVAEFLKRWKAAPPAYIPRWGNKADENSLCKDLDNRANKVFSEMANFDPPSVRLVEKNISPKNVEDPRFIDKLKIFMERRPVPKEVVESMFTTAGAAPRTAGPQGVESAIKGQPPAECAIGKFDTSSFRPKATAMEVLRCAISETNIFQ